MRDLAIAHENLGIAAATAGNLDEALQRHHRATSILRRVADSDSQNVQAWQSLAISLMHEGDVVQRSRSEAGAPPQEYGEALGILTDLQEAHPSKSAVPNLIERVQARVDGNAGR